MNAKYYNGDGISGAPSDAQAENHGGVSGAFNFMSADEDLIAKIFKHTFTQSIHEGVQGGNVFHGMMMGAVSGAGGHLIDRYQSSLGRAGEIAASAILGGTVDELGGGKFANGAITSAFSMMFNELMHGGVDGDGFSNNAEIEERGGIYYLSGHVVGEKGLDCVWPEFDVILVGKSIIGGIFSLFPKRSFSTVGDVISKSTYIKTLKHGEIEKAINAEKMETVFMRLAKSYKATVKYTKTGNLYFTADGYRVQMYNSSSGVGNSLQINTGQQIYKVRLLNKLK